MTTKNKIITNTMMFVAVIAAVSVAIVPMSEQAFAATFGDRSIETSYIVPSGGSGITQHTEYGERCTDLQVITTINRVADTVNIDWDASDPCTTVAGYPPSQVTGTFNKIRMTVGLTGESSQTVTNTSQSNGDHTFNFASVSNGDTVSIDISVYYAY
jgi:hypothetical protein